jgi:hypothetical protein
VLAREPPDGCHKISMRGHVTAKSDEAKAGTTTRRRSNVLANCCALTEISPIEDEIHEGTIEINRGGPGARDTTCWEQGVNGMFRGQTALSGFLSHARDRCTSELRALPERTDQIGSPSLNKPVTTC